MILMVVVGVIAAVVAVAVVAVSPMVKVQKDKRIQRPSQMIHLMSQQRAPMAQHIVADVAVAQQVMVSLQVRPSMKMALSQLLRSAKSVRRLSAQRERRQSVEHAIVVIAIVVAVIHVNTASHIVAVEPSLQMANS
jgi:hypothetical protein